MAQNDFVSDFFFNSDECNQILDVAIAADISLSMKSDERTQLTKFINDLVDKLGVSPGGNHFALSTFGADATLHNNLNDPKYHYAGSFKIQVKYIFGYHANAQICAQLQISAPIRNSAPA